MKWFVKSYANLTVDNLYRILAARQRVFVVEQNRVYEELDPADRQAYHLWAEDDDGTVVAYTRIFKQEDHVTFGRVLVAQSKRGTGLSKPLLKRTLAFIDRRFPGLPVIITAQIQVQTMYENYGFVAQGDVFTYHSTPHIRMERQGKAPMTITPPTPHH